MRIDLFIIMITEPESSPITDRTFWTFDVWDPGVSSTTSSTTTPPTTATITTRPLSTSSVNTLVSRIH